MAVGASGFIGTRFCRRMQQNPTLKFSIIDKASSNAFPELCKIADVRNLDTLRSTIEENSIIVNLAAEHRDDVRPLSLYDDVNVGGAKNICVVAREKNVNTIVFTSSVAVYGFAPVGTDESGTINPFNDYGRTKYEAEQVFRSWQAEAPETRTLIVIRPTVVFGEQNRGNVYNLLKQISTGRFLMIGHGNNRKSMAYVENITAFIEYALTNFKPGAHTYNYIDKPDFTMNVLLSTVNRILGKSEKIKFRMPFWLGFGIGKIFDLIAAITGKRFAVSSIRIKKFCSNTVFGTSIEKLDFKAPVPISEALERTVRHEFIESHGNENVFYTE
ncbi:NAD-dependent epimerase/dehydratase family protein [Undibacterium sp. Ji67W]|uniref:NAD-dependent epimerase/dehydratase family protein n=1 Tax=Undibacterium sp. Ji67W TaxID=3413042 RepID=UPI003BEFACD2